MPALRRIVHLRKLFTQLPRKRCSPDGATAFGRVIRGRRCAVQMLVPDYAEFIIGPAEGRTRWLHPGYGHSLSARNRISRGMKKPV
jgi:hypothetical protein